MSFRSSIPPKAIIIDDGSPSYDHDWHDGTEHKTRGRMPRDYSAHPLGEFGKSATRLKRVIPRSEWPARIEEREKTKTRNFDRLMQAGWKVLDQNGTNYCWINGPTAACEGVRITQGLPFVRLSPASVGAPIKNFRNNGGWGTEGLEYVAEKGLIPASNWPCNAIDRKYYTDANNALRINFRCDEWLDLKPGTLDELFTALFEGHPAALGYNWWSHEIMGCDPLYFGGEDYGLLIANSWGPNWSDNGFGVLRGSKAVPDDAVAPRSMTPYFGAA